LKKLFILPVLFLVSIHCREDSTTALSRTSLFVELGKSESGIEFSNDLAFTPELNIIEYLYYNNGGGVAIGDLDNDGFEDIFLTANQQPDKLYRNKGNLQFENISESAGISSSDSWSSGVTIDDINGDGWKDIYVCKVASVSSGSVHNELYINQKNGTFKEMSEEYGLNFSGYSTQASFFDYDKDGDLDMYLLNHSVHSTKSYGPISKRTESDDLSGDRFYENRINESESKFIDQSSDVGIYSSALGYGLGVITSDLNGDGWVDIYVGNDFHENDYLYINNGDGTFIESIEKLVPYSSQFTMGVDAADIDGDGTIDIFTTDMMPFEADIMMKSGGNDSEQIVKIKKDFGYHTQYSRNMMLMNNRSNGFSEEGFITGTYASDWSWSVLLQDFDNDGSTDIYIANGIVNRPNDLDYIQYINTPSNRQKDGESNAEFNRRLINEMPTLKLQNVLFTQEGPMSFSAIKKSGVGEPNYSNGSAYADLDKDGDLDLVSNNVNAPLSILINQSSSSSHFVAFDLSGEKNSTVEIYYDGKSQKKEYTTTRGYQSSSSHFVHFGLGENIAQIDSVIIVWSSGEEQTVRSIAIDQYHSIEKERTQTGKRQVANVLNPYHLNVIPIQHKENNYDDLDHEPLLPYRFSQEGPCVLYNDFNKDGYKDLLLGGARGEPMTFFLGGEQVPFVKKQIPDFRADSKYEDVDAAIMDFNKDGFHDIYVVSGGNEHNELDKNLEDRIYINDQSGGFYRLKISLPHLNGSSVAVSDFDGDGYEDFFVGSSNVPGAFGVSPVSFIIKNVNGERLEIVYRDRLGMVSDAEWIDINNDGKKELIVVGKWMPIHVMAFDGDSTFIEMTSSLGIPDARGLFNCLEAGDINGDDKTDLIIGNVGLNTALSLGENGNVDLYISDFDQNSFVDPIVFNNYFGEQIPFSDKVTLQGQMPSIKKTFSSFEKFTQFKSIENIRDEDVLMETKYINTLSSFILLSNDSGYEKVSLPRECQLSSINDLKWNADQSQLIAVGNENTNSHALGQTLSYSGAVLAGFDGTEKSFKSYESLNLPFGTISKEIVAMSSDEFMIINNNDVQYQVVKKK
jgi:hypothetical protein